MSDVPHASDAYTRIALRLRELGSADREWLLSRLSTEDCQRVSTALQTYRAESASPQESEHPQPSRSATPPEKSLTPEDATLARLKSAKPNEIKQALSSHDNWVIALVLSGQHWPWTPEFLGSLPPERIRALRALAHDLPLQVKPAFKARVLERIAGTLQPPNPPQPFEVALQRALGGWTSDTGLRERL